MKKLLFFSILIFALVISAFKTAYAGHSIDITAYAATPTISYSTPQLYTQNVAIASLIPTVTGGTAASYSVSPSLPAGLSIDLTTGIISGTPTTASSATTYAITASNAQGQKGNTFSLTIAVNPASSVISYSPAIFTFSQNTYGTTATPTNTGGTILSWSSSPALPTGLTFSADTSGTIAGTPTVLQSGQLYTITATSASGSNSFIIMISVSTASSLGYDWTGSTGDGKWTTVGNWNYNGSVATSYPGQSATNTNIVRFGVGTSFTKSPTISSTPTTSIASIEVGTNAPNNFNLTIGTNTTLPITGNFTLDPASSGGVKATLTGLSTTTSLLSIGGDYYAGSNATFVNSGCPVTIYGNFTNYSSKVSSFGTALLTFNSGNGSYKLKSYKGTTFNNVLFTGSGVALIQKLTGGAGIFYISSTGTMAFSGNTQLNVTSGKLTLLSDATGSATVTAIPSTCQVNGTVGVQRYISGTRGYRFLSAPIYTGTDSYNNKIYSISYLKNSIYISGSLGTSGGFDWAGNPSLFLYREDNTPDYTTFVNTNYRGVASLLTDPVYTVSGEPGSYEIPVANGYQVFIRGDRSGSIAAEKLSTYTFTSVTLTASGTLNQQQVTFKSWRTPSSSYLSYSNPDPTLLGYNLVGNPYPSSIDWDKLNNTNGDISGTNISDYIYSYNFILKQYAVYQKGNAGIGSNGASNVIGSGQGFFVVATASGATLTFNEAAKTSSSYTGVTTLMSKQPVTAAAVLSLMRLKMTLDSVDSDETIIVFNKNAKSAFDPIEDAPYKPGNSKASLTSLSQDSVNIAINHLPLRNGLPVRLNVNSSVSGTFMLSLEDLRGIPKMYDIWLKDNFAGDSVNLRITSTHSFTIDRSNPATFGKNRFAIIVKQDSAYTYKLLSFNAARVGNSSHVETHWTTANEENYTNFTVERSTDGGNTFTVVGGLWGTGAGAYTLVDKDAVTGTNLYRLKSEDINNTITYSNIATVVISENGNNNADKIHLYPNPTSSIVNMDVLDKTNGNISYNITVSNSTGFIVKQVTSSQPNWQADVSALLPGTYLIRVINSKTQDFIGESKLIKL